jgi:hypothetical protein
MVRQASAMQQTYLQETRANPQFQRFLEAADRLGPHLTNDGFAKILSSLVVIPLEPEGRDRREKATAPRERAISLPSGSPQDTIAPTERATLSNRQDSLPTTTPPGFTPRSDSKTDVSIIVRLHFVEAMMVLLFNALDEKKQDSVKDGFGSLLKKVENLEILGAPPATLQAYREALGAMHGALESNPQPEELAAALGDDFAKRFRRYDAP